MAFYRRIPAIERFFKRVHKLDTGCWLWTGGHNGKYGVFRPDNVPVGQRHGAGVNTYAHRFIYAHTYGPIPDGLFVCHKCDIKLCVNPDHLFLGTNSENIRDAVAKGFKVGGPNYGEANGRAVLNPEKVRQIRERRRNGEKMRELAKEFGVSGTQISWVVSRKSWKHVI